MAVGRGRLTKADLIAMSQCFIPNNRDRVETTTDPGILGPIKDQVIDMRIIAGQTVNLSICLCESDEYTIATLDPATQTANLNSTSCIEAQDCVLIYGHDTKCEPQLVNGQHLVTAVDVDRDSLTLNGAPISFTGEESFVVLPSIPGCDDEVVTPPRVCRLLDTSQIEFCGNLMNRPATDDTRLLLAANTNQGSNLIQLMEQGEVFVGDKVNVPRAGITDACVSRAWEERGSTWIELDGQTANATGCFALTSEVGSLATFKFRKDACDTAAGTTGCLTATLSASQTKSLPLQGDKVEENGCDPYYRIGWFSIFASYYDEYLDQQSALIARGCVRFFPTTKKSI